MYSFHPTEEQSMLIDSIHRFATADLRPAGREADEGGELPGKILERGWRLGVLQASIPESFGGFGEHSSVTGVLAAEELAFGDLAGAFALGVPGLFALPILMAGSSEQRREYLPKIVQND